MLPAHRLRRVLTVLAAAVCSSAAFCAAQGVTASAGRGAIALVLPFYEPAFSPAAEAVRQGVEAANRVDGNRYTIQLWHTNAEPDKILAAYDSAVAAGAKAVIGPMTREGVAALAAANRGGPPTVALNLGEPGKPLPHGMYAFGLALDAEARVVARTMWRENLRNVAVVGTTSPLSQRSVTAFADEWVLLGGRITDVFSVPPDAELGVLKQALVDKPPEAVFLAAEPERAPSLRPYLGSQMPVWMTSQINTGGATRLGAIDLAGVRFLEMPWLLQPDHPAVAVYPRAPSSGGDLERFYALGIDAFRIAAALADGQVSPEIDGVTGHIRVLPGGSVIREPVPATFHNGVAVPLK
jgi:outer membrane PBP1 activator LpoA protein